MTRPALPAQADASQRHLAHTMRHLAGTLSATGHLLAECRMQGAEKTVVVLSSSWSWDMLAEFGAPALLRAAEPGEATFPGTAQRLRFWHQFSAHDPVRAETGLIVHALPVGQRRFLALYSNGQAHALRLDRARATQMRAIYAVSGHVGAGVAQAPASPLSQRERECLKWVAEGKTTDEVAVILGVSAHTINGYVSHAIQKVSATNRAMAIASAIRNGLI